MMVKVMLDHMFFMPNYMVTLLKEFLEKIANNGLTTDQVLRIFKCL